MVFNLLKRIILEEKDSLKESFFKFMRINFKKPMEATSIFKKYKKELIELLIMYKQDNNSVEIHSIHEILEKLNIIYKLSIDKDFLIKMLKEYLSLLNKNRLFFDKEIERGAFNKDLFIDWAITVGLGSKKVELNNEGGLPYVPNTYL